MIGYKLTVAQANLIANKKIANSGRFNPVTDINGDYFIFEGEVNGCTNEEYLWVKDLPQAEYVAPINNEI